MYGIEKEKYFRIATLKEQDACNNDIGGGCGKTVRKGSKVLIVTMPTGCNGTDIVNTVYCKKCAARMLGMIINDVEYDHSVFDVDDVKYVNRKARSVAKKLGISEKKLREAIKDTISENNKKEAVGAGVEIEYW